MFLALLEEVDQENRTEIVNALADHPSVWTVVKLLLRQLVNELDSCSQGMLPVIIEVFSVEQRRQTYKPLMESRYQTALDALVELLQRGVDNGEFNPLIPVESIARLIVSVSDGLIIDTIQLGVDRMDGKGQIQAMTLALEHLLGIQEEGKPA